MDRIISTMGEAVIMKVERRADGLNGWERRNGFIGFEGNLNITASEDGLVRASIDNGKRCIRTSPGRFSFRGSEVTFETENSIYTFRLIANGSTGVFDVA
ncbi:MAG: hypothetical protein IJR91_07795 [Ruminococcus sp.]|nr:hypothetical protein [Ruminococcus sp.]